MGHYDDCYESEDNKRIERRKKKHARTVSVIERAIRSKGIAEILADIVLENNLSKYEGRDE